MKVDLKNKVLFFPMVYQHLHKIDAKAIYSALWAATDTSCY